MINMVYGYLRKSNSYPVFQCLFRIYIVKFEKTQTTGPVHVLYSGLHCAVQVFVTTATITGKYGQKLLSNNRYIN